MPLLDVRHLVYHYRTRRGPVRAVDDVSFAVNEAECLALVGESGCGKTSTGTALLRVLPRNVERLEGQVLLGGTDVMDLSEEEFRTQVRWKGISMVFQGAMNALSPTQRVGYQVGEPLTIHADMTREEAFARAVDAMRDVRLPEDIARRYPHELSGGMKQRVVIAMALILKPRLVILDEPTSALDVMTQANIMNLLQDLKREHGLSYIFITHDLSLASGIAESLAIMYAGQIAEIGSADDVFVRPQHPYTQKLLGSVPQLRKEEAPEFIPGAPPDLTKPPEGCRFHPRCPYAFELCGWTAKELADRLKREGSGVPSIGPTEAPEPGQLVIAPPDGMKTEDLQRELSRFFRENPKSDPAIKAVKGVTVYRGNVIVWMVPPKSPELFPAGKDSMAACWLLMGDRNP